MTVAVVSGSHFRPKVHASPFLSILFLKEQSLEPGEEEEEGDFSVQVATSFEAAGVSCYLFTHEGALCHGTILFFFFPRPLSLSLASRSWLLQQQRQRGAKKVGGA